MNFPQIIKYYQAGNTVRRRAMPEWEKGFNKDTMHTFHPLEDMGPTWQDLFSNDWYVSEDE